jgi:hypothetical protein
MWLEIIVGGGIVTFSQVGRYVDPEGHDPRCKWAPRIESEARKLCGRDEWVTFADLKGDLSIRIHEDAVESVVRAITEAEPLMSEYVRAFYQRVSYLLEDGERVRPFDLT